MIMQQQVEEPLTIRKKVYQGYGLADWQGRKVFVTGGIPGDVVKVKLTHRKKDVFFAQIEEIIESSPSRRPVSCNAFGSCGGCDWLNIKREDQLIYKNSIINDFFLNIECDEIYSPGFCDKEFHYRNKCFYPLQTRGGKPVFGMYARFSHELVMHNSCLIQPDIFDSIAEDVCGYLKSARVEIYDEQTGKGNARYIGFRTSRDTKNIQVILVTRKRKLPFTRQLVRMLSEKYPQVCAVIQNINPIFGNVILGKEEKLLSGSEYLNCEVCGRIFKVSYKAFFQVNIPVLEAIINFSGDYLTAGNTLIDVYCGTGVLGICMAARYNKIIGIDNSLPAIVNARDNALANGIENCEYICADATDVLPQMVKNADSPVLIFDPPRKGLTDDIIMAAAASSAETIIYISCNPATQVRDIKKLIAEGYKVAARKAFDMFPQTWHIENVAILKRK